MVKTEQPKAEEENREIIAKKSNAYIVIGSVALCLLALVMVFIYFNKSLIALFPLFVAALIGYAIYLLFLILKAEVLISKDNQNLYVVTGLKKQTKIPLDSISQIKYKVGRIYETSPTNSFGKVLIYTRNNHFITVTNVADLQKTHTKLVLLIKKENK